MTRPEISTVARRGSSSAARAVTGAFSHLRTGMNDADCRSERIETDLEEDLRVVAGMVPPYKETEAAHREAAESHMFEGRMAHMHGQIAEMRDALRGEFERTFELAEHDSLSLAATTMTGPAGWVYWQPRTLEIFNAVRELRTEADVPVYFSVDTGAASTSTRPRSTSTAWRKRWPTAASTPASGRSAVPHRSSTSPTRCSERILGPS